jgi:hypothetical protein
MRDCARQSFDGRKLSADYMTRLENFLKSLQNFFCGEPFLSETFHYAWGIGKGS